MKNLYVLPTERPSRLFYNVGGGLLFKNYENHNGVNIYITSDEEIVSLNEINSLPLSNGKDIQTDMSNI